MGVTTNAVLFYGYCWQEETNMPWTIGDDEPPDVEEEWEDRYLLAICHGQPPKDYGDRIKLVKKSTCIVDSHCAGTCPMPFVAVRASVITAHRGDMKEVKSLDVGKTWDDDLDKFCELMEISTEGQKPRWWLVAYWDGQ